jgi:DNA-binding XRE family transcriptional regulator
MKARRPERAKSKPPAQRKRIAETRKSFQADRPGVDDLLESGDVSEFVSLGEYLSLRDALDSLRAHRKQKRLSLATVASRSGIDKAAISRLEAGLNVNPTLDTLNRYAAAVGVEMTWSIRPLERAGRK